MLLSWLHETLLDKINFKSAQHELKRKNEEKIDLANDLPVSITDSKKNFTVSITKMEFPHCPSQILFTFSLSDLIGHSPYCLPLNSDDIVSENFLIESTNDPLIDYCLYSNHSA